MGTTTLLALEALLSDAIGDWLEFDTTTNVTTGTTARVISTVLNSHDDALNDYFNLRWLYITEGNNAAAHRKVKDYISTAAMLKLYGSALLGESSAVTCRLHRFNRDNKIKAIKRAIEQIYPLLFKELDDRTLISGSILPNGHFDYNGSSTTTPTFCATSNVTPVLTTTAGLFRGGKQSIKLTATAGNGYLYFDSNTYPRLLDLMGNSVTFRCWAYPEVANDAFLTIYTLQADGTAQTLTSVTACPAGQWTLLELEDQALNADLVRIQFRFLVSTNAKYVYFDDAMVTGKTIIEYMLPEDLQTDAHVSQVRVQNTGYYEPGCYDLDMSSYGAREEFRIIEESVNGTRYKFLQLKNQPLDSYRMWLKGYRKLEIPTTDSGTISLDGARLNLIVAYAAHLLYEMEKGVVSAQDRSLFESESRYWLNKYRILINTLMMQRPSETMYTG